MSRAHGRHCTPASAHQAGQVGLYKTLWYNRHFDREVHVSGGKLNVWTLPDT